MTPEEVDAIKLPAPCSVEIYDIDKIVHPKSKLSTIEKINHFIKLEQALLDKLDMIKNKKLNPVQIIGSNSGSGINLMRQQSSALSSGKAAVYQVDLSV